MGGFDRAIVSPGHHVIGKTARGDDVTVIARAEATNGILGIWSSVIAPGTGPDWHTHKRETEVFHVLSGNFRFWCGTEIFDGGPGMTIVLPPNVPHQWKNVGSEPGKLFTFATPGGFEQNFLDIAELDAVTPEALAKIDARLGVVDGLP
jgi:mannose-6-phosphate isomerase-like protein (cupin superfamily)